MARLFTPAIAALGLLACGPVQSTSFLMDAEVQLEAARTAGADKYAVYEWTAAKLYIHKAREEVGHSAYESAVDYARKAKTYATEARDKAVHSPAKGELPPSPAPEPAPATPPATEPSSSPTPTP
jgi:hypothetical protein